MKIVIELVESLNREGRDKVIEYLRESNFSTAQCYKHHKYRGGLLDHTLEVYELMMKRRGNLPIESVIVCALFHDLGKTTCKGYTIRKKGHYNRSLAILDKCGFQLTDSERSAIANHHAVDGMSKSNPLRYCLSKSDMTSTGKWKTQNHDSNTKLTRRIKDYLLYHYSLH